MGSRGGSQKSGAESRGQKKRCGQRMEWALLDLNQRPTDYESAALTN